MISSEYVRNVGARDKVTVLAVCVICFGEIPKFYAKLAE